MHIEDLKSMRDEFRELTKHSQNQVDKNLLYIAAGSIVVSGSLLSELEKFMGLSFLVLHWLAMLSVVLIVLWSFKKSRDNFSIAAQETVKKIKQWESNKSFGHTSFIDFVPYEEQAEAPDLSTSSQINKEITFLNQWAFGVFSAGLLFLFIFGFINIMYHTCMSNKENTEKGLLVDDTYISLDQEEENDS